MPSWPASRSHHGPRFRDGSSNSEAARAPPDEFACVRQRPCRDSPSARPRCGPLVLGPACAARSSDNRPLGRTKPRASSIRRRACLQPAADAACEDRSRAGDSTGCVHGPVGQRQWCRSERTRGPRSSRPRPPVQGSSAGAHRGPGRTGQCAGPGQRLLARRGPDGGSGCRKRVFDGRLAPRRWMSVQTSISWSGTRAFSSSTQLRMTTNAAGCPGRPRSRWRL